MLFGEKYPDPVRMVSVGEFSKELCGGIHVSNSSDITAFEIVVEENVGSGTRRIQALTGDKASAQIAQNRQDVASICERLKVGIENFQAAVLGINEQVKSLKKQISSGRKSKQDAATVTGGDPATVADADYFQLRTELRSIAEALNIAPSKVAERVGQMIAEIQKLEADLEKLSAAGQISAISRDLVDQGYHAGNWIKEIAPVVGGRGGGKPDMAQAGGSDPAKIAEAITAAAQTLKSLG